VEVTAAVATLGLLAAQVVLEAAELVMVLVLQAELQQVVKVLQVVMVEVTMLEVAEAELELPVSLAAYIQGLLLTAVMVYQALLLEQLHTMQGEVLVTLGLAG
jgi:hypothetical protein